MDKSEKTYKILKKITEKMFELVEKTNKDLNKILSLINKCKDLGPDKIEYRDAFKAEFLAILSKRITGKQWTDER